MDNGTRTPFGELLVSYRRHLGLSQHDLAARTAELAKHDDSVGAISVRTIVRLERPVDGSTARRGSRHDTAHSLAIGLNLHVGTSAYAEFMEAARRPGTTPVVPVRTPAESISGVVEAGREPALQALARAFDNAASGSASVLLLRGELGTGKSTLIAHACNLALARHPGAVVLWGEADDHQVGHDPLLRIVRQMLGDPDPAASDHPLAPANHKAIVARAGIAARALATDAPSLVGRVLSSTVDWRSIVDRIPDRQSAQQLARLATTVPGNSTPTKVAIDPFLRAIAHYAAKDPVYLVLDDLHHADRATLGLLQQLISRVHHRRGLKLAIVGACLPDRQLVDAPNELGHLLDDIQRLFPHGSIDLDNATTGAAASAFAEAVLARAGLPSDPTSIDALVQRTGGNPHYITQVIDAMRDRPETNEDLATAIASTVPSELAGILNARVRRLPAELQRILLDASVLGPDFYAETLMRMLDLSTERFIELVDRRLWRHHGMLRADGTSITGGHVTHTYLFDPPLLRDALYAELSELERTHAHGLAAEALRDLHGELQHARLDRLAWHLERSGHRDEAARTYLRAGNQARSQRDFDLARHLLGRVDQLDARTNDPETWIRMQISLGLCARGDSDLAAAQTHLGRALDLATTWHDETMLATALEAIGMLDFDTGNMARGRDRILRAVDIWSAHDAPETSRALANLSYLLYGLGHYADAISSAERARKEATRTHQTAAWVDGTTGLANCWIDLGRYERAAELHQHALLVANELGDRHRQRISLVNLALIATERGDWGAAEIAIDRIVSDGEPLSGPMEGVIAFHSGLVAEGRGNHPAARAHYQNARDLRDRNGQEALAIDAVAGELRIVLADGSRPQASALFDELERRLAARQDGIDGVEHPGRLYATLIEAAPLLDRPELARQHAHAAIAFLTERAGHVPEADRESYLWGVKTHRRILELATSLGVIAG